MNIQTLYGSVAALLMLAAAGHAQDWRMGRENPKPDAVLLPAAPSLPDYIRAALAANPSLDAAYADYRAAVAQIGQEKSLPNPTAGFEQMRSPSGARQDRFGLSQTLPWFGKLHARGRAAYREAEAAWQVFEGRRLAVVRDVTVAYYDLVDLSKTTQITRESASLLDGLEPVVETNLRGGGELKELLRLQVEMGRVRDRLALLEKQKPVAVARMNALLAREAEAPVPWPQVSGTRDLPPPVPVEPGFESQNPELEAIRQQILAGNNRVRIARLEHFPDVTLGVNYYRMKEPESGMAASSRSGDPWGAMISFELPIWFDRIRAQRREAEARVASLAGALDDTSNRLNAELVEYLADMKDARRRLALYGDSLLPKGRQVVELTESSYRANTASTLDLVDAQRSILELEILYWGAYADFFRSRARAEAIYGKALK